MYRSSLPHFRVRHTSVIYFDKTALQSIPDCEGFEMAPRYAHNRNHTAPYARSVRRGGEEQHVQPLPHTYQQEANTFQLFYPRPACHCEDHKSAGSTNMSLPIGA